MRRLAPILLACIPLLAACGEERESAPDVFAVKAPKGAKKTVFKRAGITLERPANWKLRRRDAPGVFEILSGEAVVTGWAYPREENLPEAGPQLEAAMRRLVEAAEEGGTGFRLISAETTEVASAPAIEVHARQVISKRELETRSVHVFEGEVEYVFEAIAPRRRFGVTDEVLERALRSLVLTGEVAEAPE